MADSRSPRGRDERTGRGGRGGRRPGQRPGRTSGRPESTPNPASPSTSDAASRTSRIPAIDETQGLDPLDIPAPPTRTADAPAETPAPEPTTSTHGTLSGLWAGVRRAVAGRSTSVLDPLANSAGSQRIRSLLEARSTQDRPRSRFTARAAILLVVLAALTISFASSLRAYVAQRDHLQELRAGNEQLKDENSRMAEEISRWDDPSYQKAQAREQLGYMFPGERGYKVLGLDGQPIEANNTLPEPAPAKPKKKTPWWDEAWTSVELAGNPPKAKPTYDPNTTIDGDDADVAEGTKKP